MVFIVAEIGVNWNGDFELLQKMVLNAKTLGCDAVKFQAYNESILGNHPEIPLLMKSTVTKENIQKIDKIANDVGIEWFCTPMYLEAVSFLEPFVKRFKIRELDGRALLKDQITPFAEAVINTGKEVIVSSENSPKSCKYYHNSNIKWLYCVPKYPCNLDEINFKEISDFDGYSNHSPDIIAPLTAATLGAKIIEIHITSDKSKHFIDNNVSFDYKELESLVGLIRRMENIEK